MKNTDGFKPSTSGDSELEVQRLEPVTLEYVQENYDKADSLAKEVANYRDEVAIPAINELRYAGHHILRAVAGSSAHPDQEQLLKAIYHCQRAMYEAADAGIISALSMISIFHDDYRNTVITDVVHEYPEIISQAREAQSLLEKERYQTGTDPVLPYKYVETFRLLVESSKRLEDCREELNKKVRKERNAAYVAICGLSLAGLAIAVSIMVAVLQ